MLLRLGPAVAFLLVLLFGPAVRADAWRETMREDLLDEQILDGDIDAEDYAMARVGRVAGTGGGRGESWVSLVGFANQLLSGKMDVGGIVVVGLALDRLGTAKPHRLADPSHGEAPPSSSAAAGAPSTPPSQTPQATPTHPLLVAPALAHACVSAALRASGLGVDDSQIDSLLSRARASAWLPETRMRAMRLVTDAAHATTLATTDGTNYYEAVGAHLVLELRLTWRLDRILYSGDEATLERIRLDRQEARSRLAGRTLEVLFAWQRAVVDARGALVGSDEEEQARLRASEAQATLDVLTDGWFSRRGDRR